MITGGAQELPKSRPRSETNPCHLSTPTSLQNQPRTSRFQGSLDKPDPVLVSWGQKSYAVNLTVPAACFTSKNKWIAHIGIRHTQRLTAISSRSWMARRWASHLCDKSVWRHYHPAEGSSSFPRPHITLPRCWVKLKALICGPVLYLNFICLVVHRTLNELNLAFALDLHFT